MEKLFLAPATVLSALVGVSFENTLQTGQVILGVILAVGTIAGIVYGVKWRTAYEVEAKVSEGLKSLADVREHETRLIQNQLVEAQDLITNMKVTVERLSKLEDIATVLTLINESTARADEKAQERLVYALDKIEAQMAGHEASAEKRANRIVQAIKAERSI